MAQSPPVEEPEKKKAKTATTRLRLPEAKPAWTAPVRPADHVYWSAPAKIHEKASAQDPQQPAQQAEPPGIADNSFLIEEAYNQEFGVVQHISTFSKAISGDGWDYSFTQEWPFNPAPKSQLSYTITAVSGGVPGAGSVQARDTRLRQLRQLGQLDATLTPVRETPLDVLPLIPLISVAMNDNVGHAECGEVMDAGLIRKAPQLVV